jgi:hypothetical protein
MINVSYKGFTSVLKTLSGCYECFPGSGATCICYNPNINATQLRGNEYTDDTNFGLMSTSVVSDLNCVFKVDALTTAPGRLPSTNTACTSTWNGNVWTCKLGFWSAFCEYSGGSGNIDGLLGAIQPVFIRAVCLRLPRVWTLLCATGAAASRRSASLRSTRCSRCSRYDGYSPMATPAAMVRWYDSNVGGLSSADIGDFSGARASRCAAHVSIWIRVCYRL